MPERILQRDLADRFGPRTRTDGPYADNLDVDCLIVGGGFGGVYSLYELRKTFPKTVLFEAGNDFGGTWRWNVYPGARVDSPVPIYQLNIPEVYNTWHWTTNYPAYPELQAYFDHCDKVLDLSKDCAFNSVVTSGEFDTKEGKWTIKTADGRTAKARFLIISAGFAAKRYIPDVPGMDTFKGHIAHSSFWPAEGVDWKGKKVGIIGTGASGVQMIQEMGPEAKELTVFMRTPNLALPMGRFDMTKEEQDKLKPYYKEIMAYREQTFAGFHYDLCERNTFDDTPEEREKFLNDLWDRQGFSLWLGGYKDYLADPKANRVAYDLWRKRQSPRVKNPEKKRILFPEEPPHPFGVKRPCLEQDYYEVLDRDNVNVVSLKENPIERFTEKGIVTSDGKEHEFDIVGLATGFDVVTGGLTNMGLKSIKGNNLKDEWKEGAKTYLGTMIADYPNLFHLVSHHSLPCVLSSLLTTSQYGPHGPTLLSNGPTSVEIQARWIRDAIKKVKNEDFKYVNPTVEAQEEYKKRILALARGSLFVTTRSTYMGSAVPGKAFEPTCYHGGVNAYGPEIRAALDSWKGIECVKA